MNGSGRAGSGRGNSRKRPFRRRDRENDSWQDGESSSQGNGASFGNGVSYGNGTSPQKRFGGPVERKNHNRLSPGSRPQDENVNRQNRNNQSRRINDNSRAESRGEKAPVFERPKWIPPSINTEPLPVPDCPYCGKPIRDISSAIADKESGLPVHFDCVTARITKGEILEKGDIVTYIGGGRFGIVGFGITGESSKDSSRGNSRNFPNKAGASADSDRFQTVRGCDFKIKKIIEWENKDKRAEWRATICDHYSVT